MGAPLVFIFLYSACGGRIGFYKKKNRQAKRILLCFRLPVDWVCVPETMDLAIVIHFLVPSNVGSGSGTAMDLAIVIHFP